MECKQISLRGDLPKPRSGHSMIALSKLYLFGGYAGTEVFDELWTYDTEGEGSAWMLESVTPSPEGRSRHAIVYHPLNEDAFLVFGGSASDVEGHVTYFNDVWEFNTKEGSWADLFCSNPSGGLPSSRHGHSFTIMDNKVILYGGYTEGAYLSDMWRFDVEGQEWTELTPLLESYKTNDSNVLVQVDPPTARQGHSLIQITETKLFLFGGEGEETFFSDIWECDLENMRWVELTMLGVVPRGRYGHVMTVFDNRIMLFGGFSNIYLNDLWEFDLRSLRWFEIKAAKGVLPSPRFQHTLVSYGDKMIVFGGFGDDGNLNDFWELSWSENVKPPTFSLPAGDCNHTAVLSLACETSGACIYYTTDDSEPSPDSGAEFRKPISMDTLGKVTIKAMAVRGGLADSPVAVLQLNVKERTQSSPRDSTKLPTTTTSTSPEKLASPTTSTPTATPTPTTTTVGVGIVTSAAQRRLRFVEQQLAVLCNACLELGIFPAPFQHLSSEPIPPHTCAVCGAPVESDGTARRLKMQQAQAQCKVVVK